LPGVLSSAKALEKMIPSQSDIQTQGFTTDFLAEAGE
jgi:hypothetical protein